MEALARGHERRSALTHETIFARATGGLPSAIAIIRISGLRAGEALDRLSGRLRPKPRAAVVRNLFDGAGQPLDMAMVLWLPGPDTVTGEDLVELHVHGSRAVVAAVESVLSVMDDVRMAVPGEFTQRAFENGRMDLTQVEGLADLLIAETEPQRVAALAVAAGGLRAEVENWRRVSLGLAARVEAAIDYAEDGDLAEDEAELRVDIAALADLIKHALERPPPERLRDGVRVVIAGPPNAGKSSLLNALVGRDAAIVTDFAGTTRDIIEVPVIFEGLPFLLQDTAGLREGVDQTEVIGIKRAAVAIDQADIVIWLGSSDAAPRRSIKVTSMCDRRDPVDGTLGVSATIGQGLTELRNKLVELAGALMPVSGQPCFTSRVRPILEDAQDALRRAVDVDDHVVLAEELRSVLAAIDRIDGRSGSEEMLDALFSRFCLGK